MTPSEGACYQLRTRLGWVLGPPTDKSHLRHQSSYSFGLTAFMRMERNEFADNTEINLPKSLVCNFRAYRLIRRRTCQMKKSCESHIFWHYTCPFFNTNRVLTTTCEVITILKNEKILHLRWCVHWAEYDYHSSILKGIKYNRSIFF